MSRTTSALFREAITAQETDQVFLVLITIAHEELEDDIRVVVNMENITSRGQLYVAYPVDVELPSENEDSPPQARLTIDNISTEITRAVRAIRSAPVVTIEIVLADTPDLVEASFPTFYMQGVSYDKLTVSGTLTVDDFTTEPYPSLTFNPAQFPGLF